MKGPRDRCCRQSQHIHVFLHLLDLFLVGHTEALLLINDQEPQIFEFHILRKNPVRTDDNIHLALLQIFDRLFDLPRCAEP